MQTEKIKIKSSATLITQTFAYNRCVIWSKNKPIRFCLYILYTLALLLYIEKQAHRVKK